jgi:integrase
MARENSGWGDTRIRDTLSSRGHDVGRNTIEPIPLEAGMDPRGRAANACHGASSYARIGALSLHTTQNAITKASVTRSLNQWLKCDRALGRYEERPELFTSNAERRRLRVHDLRGTFGHRQPVGRPQRAVDRRTGHRSSNMIARYKRTARTFSELQCGDFTSLDSAIPELSQMANRQAFATRTAKSSESWRPQR